MGVQSRREVERQTCRYRVASSTELPTLGLRTITLSAGRLTPAAKVDWRVADKSRRTQVTPAHLILLPGSGVAQQRLLAARS